MVPDFLRDAARWRELICGAGMQKAGRSLQHYPARVFPIKPEVLTLWVRTE